ncbi:MAG: cysteine desulfurase, partial [Pseudomonadota bacterium]
FHYLDSAATSQMPAAVLDALCRFETEQRANVHGGVHRLARVAMKKYEDARAAVAAYINAASPQEVVFTYGTTSSINLAAQSYGSFLGEGDEVVISLLEHHSNIVPWQMLAQRRGVVLKAIPVTPDGRLDLRRLEDVVTEKCRLIAVTHCSNVTGAVTDTGPLVDAARAVGAKLFLDGAQRIPHGPVDVQALGTDFYAFSGHKVFGPTGIGILWAQGDLLERMPPFMGGGQMIDRVTIEASTYAKPPRRFEAGTPPIAGAIGLGAAVRWAQSLDWPTLVARELALTGRILDRLRGIAGARLIGPQGTQQRRGVVSFTIVGLDVWDLCRLLDEHGVAVRCGHHCAQPLLSAFGVGAVARASLAVYSCDADVDALLNGIEDGVSRLG